MTLKQIKDAMGTESQDELTISNKWGSVSITVEKDDAPTPTYYVSGDADGTFFMLSDALDCAMKELAELQRGAVR